MTATPTQVSALFKVLRAGIDATGWGGWVPDAKLMPIAAAGASAVVAAGPKPNPTPVVQPGPVVVPQKEK